MLTHPAELDTVRFRRDVTDPDQTIGGTARAGAIGVVVHTFPGTLDVMVEVVEPTGRPSFLGVVPIDALDAA